MRCAETIKIGVLVGALLVLPGVGLSYGGEGGGGGGPGGGGGGKPGPEGGHLIREQVYEKNILLDHSVSSNQGLYR